VPGSCLSARGNPEDNKSFASYPLDGKNKLFCIKDAEGNMIGRAVVRLLLDKEDNPVLLLDTFFSSIPYAEGKDIPSPYEQLSESITEAVKKKASMLQIPLLKTYNSSDKVHPEYGRSVLSLGGRAPLECVNAVGAQGDDELCKDSIYEIRQTQVLFVPVR
jgi:hypothetical protein